MLLLLSFLLSRRAGSCALPILSPIFAEESAQNPSFDVTTTASTGACAGRSLWDILWSCLATTFACTWVSVHPNVPFLRESKASTRRWRLYLMLLSLIAPEIMILWAFKQLQGALVIKETVNKAIERAGKPRGQGVTKEGSSANKADINKSSKKGDNSDKDDKQWTLTHAHYLQMGGFRLKCHLDEKEVVPSDFGRKLTDKDGGEERTIWELPLSFETMKALVNSKAIDLPFIKKDEILDKCGRDALSKAIALLQLTWFIIQIVARARQSLAVTELELTTAALASLNIVMYISWWSKPTDILCPTVVRSRRLEGKDCSWACSVILSTSVPSGKIPTNSLTNPRSTFSSSAPNSDNLSSSGALPCQPQQHTTSPINPYMVHPGSVYGDILLGEKVIVNLATHYLYELWKALRGSVETAAKSVVALPKTIQNFGRQVGRKWTDYFAHKGKSSVGENIRKSIALPWETIAHIFLALIYYPILAILESGDRLSRKDKLSTSDVGVIQGTSDQDAAALTNDKPLVGKRSNDVTEDTEPVTPERVENMSVVELIFNKAALRLVMDMVFFCEDVASAPFFCLSALSGAIFGIIHCLAWNFAFPSLVEQILWRTCSSVIAGLCICIMVATLGYIIFKLVFPRAMSTGAKSKNEQEQAKRRSLNITEVACSVFAICFVLTRISLLTLSIIELRSLPASAFDTVKWSGFIPHI